MSIWRFEIIDIFILSLILFFFSAMKFDPENKVLQLCAEGMGFEIMGKSEEAQKLFQKAWDIAATNFEAYTAAHYLARNQLDPKDNLKWNLEALNRASMVYEQEVQSHYPS